MADTLKRGPLAFGVGRCLRGGAYETDFGTFPPVVHTSGCRFARGLAIRGKTTWAPVFFGMDGTLEAELAVRAKGRNIGNVRVTGAYFTNDTSGRFKVRGKINGKKVALSLPST